ncbi:MAG: hypothetical protein AMXMBFR83_24520 [Phycisphaerae bacterium]
MSKRSPQVEDPCLTAAQCRAVDRYAIERLGIPGLVLMENAGRNAAELIARWARQRPAPAPGGPDVAVVCGRGYLGGDGLVIARHLLLRGLRVSVDLLGDPAGLSPDAAVNYRVVTNMGLKVRVMRNGRQIAAAARVWRRSAVLVDALLGTGFTGPVRQPMADVIRRINALARPLIVAIDVPSGLDADTGEASGPAVRAHRTITFLARKLGFSKRRARPCVGRVYVADIGAPLIGYQET